jgi:hypothetical protein
MAERRSHNLPQAASGRERCVCVCVCLRAWKGRGSVALGSGTQLIGSGAHIRCNTYMGYTWLELPVEATETVAANPARITEHRRAFVRLPCLQIPCPTAVQDTAAEACACAWEWQLAWRCCYTSTGPQTITDGEMLLCTALGCTLLRPLCACMLLCELDSTAKSVTGACLMASLNLHDITVPSAPYSCLRHAFIAPVCTRCMAGWRHRSQGLHLLLRP